MAKKERSGILVETTILVDFLRGTSAAAEYLDEVRSSGALICSAVTAAELTVGARDRAEIRQIRQVLAPFEIEPITAEDSKRALRWLDCLYHSHGVGFHDCLIAAAAVRLRVQIATLNQKHFRSIRSVKVLRPY